MPEMNRGNLRFVLLTGNPGVGKTTMTKKIVSLLQEKGIKTSGFYTEEIRRYDLREGFDVISLRGERSRLSRDVATLTMPVKHKVGKYGVLVEEFEKVALEAISSQSSNQVLVIDEIGKMEFCSKPFKERIKEIFSDTSQCCVLATIPVRKGDYLIEYIRNHEAAKVWTVTKENRNNLHEEIVNEILDIVLPTT